jgi:hypothetical protein
VLIRRVAETRPFLILHGYCLPPLARTLAVDAHELILVLEREGERGAHGSRPAPPVPTANPETADRDRESADTRSR